MILILLLFARYTDNELELGGLFDGIKRDVEKYNDSIEKIKEANPFDLFENGTVNVDKFSKVLGTSDSILIGYVDTLKDSDGVIDLTTASTKGLTKYLKETGQMFDFARLKATLFNTALNAGITFVASMIIQGVATAIDKYVNRVEYAIEAMNEAQTTIDESQKKLKSLSSTLSENKDRFLELSKGVDKFSNNLRLSEEEYKEYLSISNELAELFPSLVSGYDNQGNALLMLGNDATETNEKLQELLETEQEIARQTLVNSMDDVANGVYYEVKDTKHQIDSLKDELSSLEQQYKKFNIDISASHGVMNFDDSDYSKYGKAMEDALSAAGIKFKNDKMAGFHETAILLTGTVTPQQLQEAQNFYDSWLAIENEYHQASINGLKQNIEKKENSIQSSYSKMTANLQAWVQDNYNYQYLSNSSSSIVDALIPEIKWDELENPPITALDYQNYIENNLIKPLMEIPLENRQEINDMFSKLLSLEEGDLESIDLGRHVQSILDKLYEDGKISAKIDITPIFADEQEVEAKLSSSISNIVGDNYADLLKLRNYTKDFDKAQVNAWLSTTSGSKNADAAIKKYEASLKSLVKETENFSISSTIDSLNAKVKPVLDALADAYTAIFTEDGFSLKNVNLDMFTSVKDSLAELGEAGLNIDTSSFEDFISILSDTKSTSTDVKNAFNSFTSEILNSYDVTKFSAESFDVLVQSLESLGVTNAKETLQEVKNIQNALVKSGCDLNDMTAEQITAFLDEAEASGIAAQYLKNYALEKELANNPLDTTKDIESLENLCNSLGVTGEMLQYINSIKSAMRMIEIRETTGYGAPIEAMESVIESNKKKIQELISNGSQFKFDFDGSKVVDDNKKSSTSTEKSFDGIEIKLSNMSDALSDLDSQVDNTYSTWTERNKKLTESINKTKEAISLQNQAYQAYMREANAVGLSDTYKRLVQNGAMDISVIKDDKLADKISKYEDYYNKAQDALKSVSELQNTLNELSSAEKWELFKGESDADISKLDAYLDKAQNLIDKAELQGKFSNSSVYTDMLSLTTNKITDLKNQADQLNTILDTMTKGTEAYDELFNELLSIRNQISDLENECIEFNNNIRNLNWEVFEYLEDSISRITDEMHYLIDLVANEDLFDDKGNRTKYGDATIALHAANYDVYKQMAQDFYEEAQDLQTQLLNGAGKDILEYYNEIIEKHRDNVLAMNQERDAILDLVENSYQKQLDYLNKIIDKKKESLNAEKD